MEESNKNFEALKTAYEENARIYRYYLDWRHKVLTRYSISLGVCAYLCKEVIASQSISNGALVVIFIFMSFVSLACAMMDEKNKRMIDIAEKAGAKFEEILIKDQIEFSFFSNEAQQMDKNFLSYHTIVTFRRILGKQCLHILAETYKAVPPFSRIF